MNSDPFEEFRNNMDLVLAGELEVESAEQLVDPVIWQRLVDGRLSHDQYQELLMFAELQPELWRPCALAFLQEQVLKTAISGFENPVKNKKLHHKENLSAAVTEQHPVTEQESISPKSVSKKAATKPSNSFLFGAGKTLGIAASSLAAGFLLTLSVTSSQNGGLNPDSNNTVVSTPVVAETHGYFQPSGCVKPINTDISVRALSSDEFKKQGLIFSPEVPRTPVEISGTFSESEWDAQRRFYVFKDQDGSIYFQPIDRFEINPKDSH